MSVWRFKALRYFGPATLSVALAFSAFISWTFPADVGTYISYYGGASFDTVERVIRAIPNSAAIYIRAIEELLASASSKSAAQKTIVAAVLTLSAFGVALSATSRLTVYEVFLVAYLGALLLYPIHEEPLRYALPVLPLVILYFLYSVQKWKLIPDGALLKGSVIVAALGMLYLPQFPQYAEARKEEISVDGLEAQELYREIRERVPSDAIILCRKPTIIALYGERHATNPPWNATPEEFWRFVRQTKATWMVELKTPLHDKFSGIIPKIQGGLNSEFSNRLFTLYRILGPKVPLPEP
jgi:hypothetical protein